LASVVTSPDKWIIGTIAALGLGGSIIQFVWNGSRNDIVALDGRLNRAVSQLERQINELKAADDKHVTLISHLDLKEQLVVRNSLVDKIIDKNSNSISELLVKKDVFDRYLSDQTEREHLAQAALDREITMLRNSIQMIRVELNALRDKQMLSK